MIMTATEEKMPIVTRHHQSVDVCCNFPIEAENIQTKDSRVHRSNTRGKMIC